MYRIHIILTIIFLLNSQELLFAQSEGLKQSLLLTAKVEKNPAKITISWDNPSLNASSFFVFRKGKNEISWSSLGKLSSDARMFVDSNVNVNQFYEYRVFSTANANGYIMTCIECSLDENEKEVLIITEETIAPSIINEINLLRKDLIAEGWKVKYGEINKSDAVTSVKSYIVDEYSKSNGILKSVILVGHIPVPYSGNIAPDLHSDHRGAWPADVYYADIDGIWTDNTVNSISAARETNHNIPGDGKFDQSTIPSSLELQIGRIDLSHMSAFSLTETELIKLYFSKNHNYRSGQVSVDRRGLIEDGLSNYNDGFSKTSWRSFPTLFGRENVVTGDYLNAQVGKSYLMAHGIGFGNYTTVFGIASVNDFANKEINSVFNMFIGSYFGDWDNKNNVLRAPLGSNGLSLTSIWAGRPAWHLHHMGLGETIGYSTKIAQEQEVYETRYQRSIHIALMGDPTLRLHVMKPISNLTASKSNGINLSWDASPEPVVIGYHIYRANDLYGDFTRINSDPITSLSFNDINPIEGKNVYMVRALKLEETPSGSYYNLSPGKFVEIEYSANNQNQSPTISLSSPVDGSSHQEGSLVTLSATASDSDGSISKVEFLVDGNVVGSDATVPYSFDWTAGAAGSYQVSARAIDNEEAITTSTVISINIKPGSSIAPPSNVNATDGLYADKVVITWDEVQDASLYQVLRGEGNDTNNLVIISDWSSSKFYADTEVSVGVIYNYYVKASNNDQSMISNLSSGNSGYAEVTKILSVSDVVDFGEVYLDEEVTMTVSFSNIGNTMLEITQLNAPQEVAVFWNDTTINTGGSLNNEFRFTPSKIGIYNKKLTIDSDATRGRDFIWIKAKILERVVSTLEESDYQKTIDIYPNPVKDDCWIAMENDYIGAVSIKMTDLNGITIYEKISEKDVNDYRENIRIPDLTKGLYFVEIQIGDYRFTEKLLIF